MGRTFDDEMLAWEESRQREAIDGFQEDRQRIWRLGYELIDLDPTALPLR
jgi:hypothetical protein